MSDDKYIVQTSIKHGPGLVAMSNARGADPDEFEVALSTLVGAAPRILEAIEALGVADQIAQAGGRVTGVTTSPAAQADAAAQFCGPNGEHGQMQFRTASDGSWAGHFCPLGKENPNRCKPRYVKKG